MKKAVSHRKFPAWLLIFSFGTLLTSLYMLYWCIQWRFLAAKLSSEQHRRLASEFQTEITEVELQNKALLMETDAIRNLAQTRMLRRLASPVDWETVVARQAELIAAKWNANPEKLSSEQPGYLLSGPRKDPPYPFQLITFANGRETGIIMLAAPFFDNYYRGESARALFWRLKARGYILVGIASYQEYPAKVVNPFDDRHVPPVDAAIHNAMDAWLHCFREPDKILPPGVPRLLLSESDFHDPERNDSGGVLIPSATVEKKYDLVHSNQGGLWNDYARNWTLAKASFVSLIHELDFKILLLGRNMSGDEDLQPYIDSGHIKVERQGIPWRDFLKHLQSARSMFVPNIHDASPRVIAEALCFNMTVVVNADIVGGWKYVNDFTGEFFTNPVDVVEAFRRLRSPAREARLSPREWYRSTWGRTRSSYKLQAFIEAAVGKDRLQDLQTELKVI